MIILTAPLTLSHQLKQSVHCFCLFFHDKTNGLTIFEMYRSKKKNCHMQAIRPQQEAQKPRSPRFSKYFQRKLYRKIFRAKCECFGMFLVPLVISLAQLEDTRTNEKHPFHVSMINPKIFSLCLPRKQFTCVSALQFCVYNLR